MNAAARPARGFTLIEMVVTLALVGLLAMAASPLYQVTTTRLKESELRVALRTLRTALDAYKAASDAGQIPRQPGESGYPPNLDVLVQGVEVRQPGTVGLGGDPETRRIMFLRQIPRDPFHTDPNVAAAGTWRTRAYGTPPDEPQPGADVFDVTSASARTGLNGVPYGQW